MKTKTKIRNQILKGALKMPKSIKLLEKIGLENYRLTEKMFATMWKIYLKQGTKGTISLIHWSDRFSDPKGFNIALKVLSKAGWIHTSAIPKNNWSEASLNEDKLTDYCTIEELFKVRSFKKFTKYVLELHNTDQDMGANKMRIQGETKKVRNSMNGFALAGEVEFQFDTQAMMENKSLVVSEINKGIDKMIVKEPEILKDHANYKNIGTEIVDYYIDVDGKYNSGPRVSDPRLRNSAGYLSKIGNPVGFKIMRALLVIPSDKRKQSTPTGLQSKFLHIAEMIGFKLGSKFDKINFGRQCFYAKTQAHCPVENIWINRTYDDITSALGNRFRARKLSESFNKYLEYANGSDWHMARSSKLLDNHIVKESEFVRNSDHKWLVPIEIDMSASILGITGLLLNHKPYLDRCNITQGDLTDAWMHKIITNRNQMKTVMRIAYGSSAKTETMWDEDSKVGEYTKEEVLAYNEEMKTGEFAVSMAFKEFIINNVRPQPFMQVVVDNETIDTYCNKFKNVADHTTIYDIWDSKTEKVRTVRNTHTNRVEDLQQFKRYFVTALIHSLDGQVMNATMESLLTRDNGWALDIHDAIILCCEDADIARDLYANGSDSDRPSLKRIHTNRGKILTDFFRSINISASAINEWNNIVVPLIEKFKGELVINPMVLK